MTDSPSSARQRCSILANYQTDPMVIGRRQLIFLAGLGFVSLAAVAALQGPALHEPPKLPNCGPLPNPFSAEFSSEFGAGVGMQCATSDLPASPKIVILATPPSVGIAPGI